MRGFGGHALEPSIQHGIARAHLVHDVLRLRSRYSEIAGERGHALAVDATENRRFINLPLLLCRIENTERVCRKFAIRITAKIVCNQMWDRPTEKQRYRLPEYRNQPARSPCPAAAS